MQGSSGQTHGGGKLVSAWDLLYWYSVDVIKLYDGDSITNATLDLGFNLDQKKRKIRFDGIDTPEMRGKDITEFEKKMGAAVQGYVDERLPAGTRALIHSQKPRRRGDDTEDLDGRGRILGWVFSNHDGLLDNWSIQENGLPERAFSLNMHLVNIKLACPYDGKRARPAVGNPQWWPNWYEQHKAQWEPIMEKYG